MELQRNSHHVFRIMYHNANEEVIRAYVQNQLKEMDRVEKRAKQLALF